MLKMGLDPTPPPTKVWTFRPKRFEHAKSISSSLYVLKYIEHYKTEELVGDSQNKCFYKKNFGRGPLTPPPRLYIQHAFGDGGGGNIGTFAFLGRILGPATVFWLFGRFLDCFFMYKLQRSQKCNTKINFS